MSCFGKVNRISQSTIRVQLHRRRLLSTLSPTTFLTPNSKLIPSPIKKLDDRPVEYVQYPYFVNRTEVSGSLPVYLDRRGSGRQQILTIIRRIDGDLEALRKDLANAFPNTKSLVNHHAKQVILKGHLEREIKLYLRDRGF